MTKEQRNRLIDAVRDGLHRTGMTQKELARRGGTSSGQLSGALSGAVTMSPTKWEMCCEALGIDYKALMAGDIPVAEDEEAVEVPAEEKTWTRVLPPEETEEVDQHNDLGEEMVEMRTRLSRALEENAELKRDLEMERASKDQYAHDLHVKEMELGAARAEIKEATKVLNDIRCQNRELDEEKNQLTKQVEDLRVSLVNQTDVSRHYEELLQQMNDEHEVTLVKVTEEAHKQAREHYHQQLIKLKAAMFDQEHPELA